jgi:MoxR-like ATPase
MESQKMSEPIDWKVFHGNREPHDALEELPAPPPWRFSRKPAQLVRPSDLDINAEASRAGPFLPSDSMVIAVNAALYLRRPLLITGKPGTGKSTLVSKVAHELKLGPVIRWPINSRSTVRSGVYEYDAVGRLQAGKKEDPPVEEFVTLGPLGTALMAETWPRPLLIDEIDKSDLDFANDLLNVIEEGYYEIPELHRLGKDWRKVSVRNFLGRMVTVEEGRIWSGQFPFVVITSNAEREFPPPFLRRCVRLKIDPPNEEDLKKIVNSHLKQFAGTLSLGEVTKLINDFDRRRKENQEVATDQLLNAVFLTVAMRDSQGRSFTEQELTDLRENLFRQLSGPAA